MPTLDDVYRKFGEVSEAAQLLETELGNILFGEAVVEGMLVRLPESARLNKKQAEELMDNVNRQTLGQLIKNAKRYTKALDQLEPLLAEALEERNRLSHHFYRQHNFRRNSDVGRLLMLEDLESIHHVLLNAYKAVVLLSGVDLDAVAEKSNKARDNGERPAADPTVHLPI